MLLKDKVAVITGGAGLNGLGYATARLMAEQGARVVVLDLAQADPPPRPPAWAIITWAWWPT
jgi:NAD(P)-dependent dehydrogenase (short-subunit alcohol dehydrogenase family)